MLMHNAYKIFSALHKQYTLDRKRLSMKQCVKELTFDLLQRGDSMRERKAEHPGYTVDLSQILGWTAGRKTRSDAKQMPPLAETTLQVQELSPLEELKKRQKKAPWLIHTPALSDKRGKEGGLPQAIPCASLHEMIQIGLNMFGLWVVNTNKLLPDLHPTFPRGIGRSPVSFTAIPPLMAT
jgi:hypothetical protein